MPEKPDTLSVVRRALERGEKALARVADEKGGERCLCRLRASQGIDGICYHCEAREALEEARLALASLERAKAETWWRVKCGDGTMRIHYAEPSDPAGMERVTVLAEPEGE